jgi:hypothetical protein
MSRFLCDDPQEFSFPGNVGYEALVRNARGYRCLRRWINKLLHSIHRGLEISSLEALAYPIAVGFRPLIRSAALTSRA